MKTVRNLVLAGILAIGAALSAGTASAAPASALEIGMPTVSTESAATPVFHYGPHYGQGRLCYVPFFKLVQWFGYWQAKRIKHRCFGYNYYNYYNYNYNYRY
jgi:hypothetical protein